MTVKARVLKDFRPARRPAAPLLAALALSTLVPAARVTAAPIPATQTTSHTMSIPLTAPAWKPGTPATITDPLSFAKFDPTLGTLKSVTISATARFEHQANVTFFAPATSTVSSFANTVELDKPNGTPLLKVNGIDHVVSQFYNGPTFPHVMHLAPTTTTATAAPLKLTAPADLAFYTARKSGDTFAMPASATAKSMFSTNATSGFGGVNTREGVDVTVTYAYAPVPEPSTLAVLGLGAATLFAARRRGR
jgi:hypothetical protein